MILVYAFEREHIFSYLLTQTTSRVDQAQIQDIVHIVTSQIFGERGNYLFFLEWVSTNSEIFSQNLAHNSLCYGWWWVML